MLPVVWSRPTMNYVARRFGYVAECRNEQTIVGLQPELGTNVDATWCFASTGLVSTQNVGEWVI